MADEFQVVKGTDLPRTMRDVPEYQPLTKEQKDYLALVIATARIARDSKPQR